MREVVPVLAAMLNVTVPGPVPLAPAVTVTHAASLLAVHAQPLGAVTVTEPDPPVAASAWLVAESVEVHVTPAWVIVTVWPAIVSVAVRAVALVLAAALNVTVPEPVPLAPAVTVAHAASLLAVHAQPLAAVTVTEPEPPVAATAWLVAESV